MNVCLNCCAFHSSPLFFKSINLRSSISMCLIKTKAFILHLSPQNLSIRRLSFLFQLFPANNRKAHYFCLITATRELLKSQGRKNSETCLLRGCCLEVIHWHPFLCRRSRMYTHSFQTTPMIHPATCRLNVLEIVPHLLEFLFILCVPYISTERRRRSILDSKLYGLLGFPLSLTLAHQAAWHQNVFSCGCIFT